MAYNRYYDQYINKLKRSASSISNDIPTTKINVIIAFMGQLIPELGLCIISCKSSLWIIFFYYNILSKCVKLFGRLHCALLNVRDRTFTQDFFRLIDILSVINGIPNIIWICQYWQTHLSFMVIIIAFIMLNIKPYSTHLFDRWMGRTYNSKWYWQEWQDQVPPLAESVSTSFCYIFHSEIVILPRCQNIRR